MDFVTGIFAEWVLERLADAGRARLVRFLLGEEQERALRGAAAAAVELTAKTFYPDGDSQTEDLARVIDQVFSDPVPVALTAQQSTLLQALHVGIAAQLAPLEDVELTETGQSSLELLGVPGAQLAERLASHLVREIIGRGARGGPLAPLANQLDHDATHLQGQVLEAKLDRVILDVEEALGQRNLPLEADPVRAAIWLGQAANSWDALELEVHRPITMEGAPVGIPEYIGRDHDRQIREVITGEMPKLIVVVGGSSTGKTRAAYEAIKQLPSDWRLHYPIYPDKSQALLAALRSGKLAPRTAVWLNELQQYLLPAGGEETAAALREYLLGNDQVLLIGTMWPEYWQELTQPAAGQEDSHSQARALLLYSAKRVDVDLEFPSSELEGLAERDVRVRMAMRADKDRVTQYIAAGPALVEFYTDAKEASPAVWAVLTAAMDWCLVEQFEQHPDTIPDFLRIAAVGYLSDEEWGSLQEDWFMSALQQTSALVRGATRPLTPIRSRNVSSDSVRYRLADYLLQHARQRRKNGPLPASFWEGVWAALGSVYLPAFAMAADDRGMYEQSAQLWETLADEGDPEALSALMRNPITNRQEIQELAIRAIENVDMDDVDTIGLILFELRDYPELRNRVVEKIVTNAQDLGMGNPLEMSEVLRELKASSHLETIPVYARRIEERIGQIDLTDFWSAAELLEELLESSVAEAKHAGSALAHLIYERCNENVGQLACFLCVIRDSDSALFQSGIRRLRLLVRGLSDITDTTSIHPLIVHLRDLQETETYRDLLERVTSSIATLKLDSGATLDMISFLRGERLHAAADVLSNRVAMEYDTGNAGHAAGSLMTLRNLMPEDVFEVFARRIANEGPILPVAEAEEVANCFAELGKDEFQRIYLRRVQQFRDAEGY